MSHVKAYGLQCPKAKGIIHLGATSAYVGDNTDVIQMNEALKLIRVKLVNLIDNLKRICFKIQRCSNFRIYSLPSCSTYNSR